MRTQLAPATADHVIDGIRIRATTYGGPGDGLDRTPAVLLIHGFPTSSQLWRQVAPEMCAGTDDDLFVIAPDLVQLGGSERTGSRIDLAKQARLLIGLLDAHGVDKVIVVGHGLGGAVAVHLAALAGRRVAGLALLDSPLHADAWPVAGALPMLIPGVRAVCGRALPLVPWLAERVLATLVGHGSDVDGSRPLDRYVDGASRARRRPRARAFRHRGRSRRGRNGLAHRARRRAPDVGDVGRRRSRAQPVVRTPSGWRDCPRAAWVPVAGAGHLLPEERPERVAEELVAFHAEIAGE